MSVCIEADSRNQGLYCQLGDKHFGYLILLVAPLLFVVYVSGLENSPAPIELKVWKTIPFVEDTLVSGTDALKLIA
jgi:hypothetical protein